jgi:hypothetical protein
MGRANWHYDHPPACTCVVCSERKNLKPKGLRSIIKNLVYKIIGRKK